MIKPVADRVLIKVSDIEKTTAGGIILSEGAQEKSLTGEVLAVGEGRTTTDGTLIPPPVKVGDNILFQKYSGLDKWEEDGEDLYLIQDKCIIGIIEED